MSTARYICQSCFKPCSMQCSRCQVATFCDKECFKKLWPIHKKECVSKKELPIDGAELQLALAALQVLDQANVGNLSGTSMWNVIGTYLGLGKAVGTGGIPKAQQDLMITDRIPAFLAACAGTYDVIISSTGKIFKGSIRDLADCTLLRVQYGKGRCRNFQTKDFRYHGPGSLAAELYALCNGRVASFKYLEGGILYLVGQAELFWPMVMHFREKGSTLPLSNPGISALETSFYGRELDRIFAQMAGTLGTSSEWGNTHLQKGLPHSKPMRSVRSESLAICQMMDRGAPTHPIQDMDELPSMPEQVPLWWKTVANFWDTHLARCGMPAGRETELDNDANNNSPCVSSFTACPRPMCMFFCTPFGCQQSANGATCAAWHDSWYKQSEMDIRNIEKVMLTEREARARETRGH